MRNRYSPIEKPKAGELPFSLRKRIRSIGYALEGVKAFFRAEHNARIHAVATVLVLVLGLVYHLSMMEAIALVLCIGFVWAAELINTAIEKTIDFMCTEQDARIKRIKDMAAAAVLVAAVTALVVGAIIFIPKF